MHRKYTKIIHVKGILQKGKVNGYAKAERHEDKKAVKYRI